MIKHILREDEFVQNIVQDPRDPPDTLFLVGFVGRASEPDHTRFYLDVLLSCYIDVPNDALLFAREIAREQSPLGGCYVWIRRSSDIMDQLSAARRKLQEVQQEFLTHLQPDSLSAVQPGWPVMPNQ